MAKTFSILWRPGQGQTCFFHDDKMGSQKWLQSVLCVCCFGEVPPFGPTLNIHCWHKTGSQFPGTCFVWGTKLRQAKTTTTRTGEQSFFYQNPNIQIAGYPDIHMSRYADIRYQIPDSRYQVLEKRDGNPTHIFLKMKKPNQRIRRIEAMVQWSFPET